MAKIARVWAREILDSRGEPTVEAICQLDNGQISIASVPGGTSAGTHEALELDDNDESRYLGEGKLKAVENVIKILGPAVVGMDPANQEEVDAKLVALDGTESKSKLGANSILAVSLVVCKAAALASGENLYMWIYALAQKMGLKPVVHVPTPLFNMINGGLHGAGNLDFQEFHVIPASSMKFSDGLRMGVEVYMLIGKNLERKGAVHSVGDEGGYAPNLFTNADALEVFVESIKSSNYSIGRDIFLGLDVAANSFFKNGQYSIKDKSTPLDDIQMLDFYKALYDQYRLAILEDPFHEDAWDSWKKLTAAIGGTVAVVGDDLLVTNADRVQKAINEKACNSILVKPNQVGTVSETIKVIKMSVDAGWKVIVSHRSGETNDTFIADFAVGVGADYVKFGAPARGERVSKYNRLLGIDMELSRLRR